MQAKNRADLCRFLAACYYEPSQIFVEEKLFDSMAAAARAVSPELGASARRLGGLFLSEGHEKLLIDYSRLFLGPNSILAQPYGSVWLDREKKLMQDSSVEVLELYEEAGFELAEDFRELPDHIAAELEFLYLLIYREAEAQATEDSSKAEAGRKLRDRFLNAHLGRWIVPFTRAVEAGAQVDFYKELASLTRGFVEAEVLRDLSGGARR
jgi:TorA maturation chaperone TorD